MDLFIVVSVVALWIVVVFQLLLSLAIIRRLNKLTKNQQGADFYEGMLEVGNDTPEIEFLDNHGKTLKRSSLTGAFVMVILRPGCAGCDMVLPKLPKVYGDVAAAGGKVITVFLSAMEDAARYLEDLGLAKDFPEYYRPADTKQFMENYKAFGTPLFYVVNKEGKLDDLGFFEKSNWRDAFLKNF